MSYLSDLVGDVGTSDRDRLSQCACACVCVCAVCAHSCTCTICENNVRNKNPK